MDTGVYAIYHKYNKSKLYIGSTKVSFNIRFKTHLNKLRKNVHCNSHLQNVCNKHGIDGFRLKIIEEADPHKCLEAEQRWIDRLDTYNNGYNQSITARNCVLNFERKVEISKNKWKSVYQLDSNNTIIKKFDSIGKASRELHINRAGIQRCCSKRKGSAGGFLWAYVEGFDPNLNRGFIRERSNIPDVFNLSTEQIFCNM